ncbi:lipid IV(A) 3-deoxy-D-manno-octulosonic acid transferase [Colwellia sp. 1_MG-2023]|uniref:lipid IV(A) 3-deoxy-D-manno-octulosonic acid transferase n=1 Tax=unclassified Colwellia TaxID=196834 RepID=UPI001C09859A|nr:MULTISPECIES: lipid IV(A) 3-deoxy-D-manno-octulosonic acid transferase [unclassified Colwellia]MBU2923696.1 lipid IV(A) 3-deoxy-D-manno-octulosonic acid transferase [Colwellia sp. C2M11]MDO6652204.1 lipid IV(A) 3-deoxy-D-manno-octulosonic acid transferase [Colwellia sp. 3_MG-2023]MDO6664627.1 lipid IV(A) 3-deoxy-D-manno-octulosonic acid transferase [Colwellia sp. 2_MG-2023]MDO6688978.1 lipid IV(A) 3-deoxy-D-manno-octulosonic acid transferase [Colwellia sp. 1_MG-2023]
MFALLIYRILLLLLTPIILLALLFRSFSNSQYRQRLSERFGFTSSAILLNKQNTKGIVVHAASVGEVIAITPFVELLLQQYPTYPITITTFTPTGSAQVKKHFGSRVQHTFLPLDILPCTSLFLNRLQPQLMIFMETELWPNLISQCANKRIKLLLINGRLSANSMKSYQKISTLITPTLNHFDKILCQSHDNLDNFLQLGAESDRCQVSGNLKFDISLNATTEDKQRTLAQFLPPHRPIWLVASTHQGDEEIALAAYNVIKEKFPQLLLVLVPRHPERFSSVAKLCINQGYSLAKRSESEQVTNHNIWLLDTLGELMAAYALADIVTMGGSFSDIGGHNPLEPALFKKPIIVGNDMKNFTDILLQLQKNNGIIQLPILENKNQQALAQAVIHLLNNTQAAQLLGSQAHKVVLNNQGASTRTLAQVKELVI